MATMTPQPLTVGALPLPATTTVPAHPSPKTTSILDEYTVTGRMLGSGLSGPVVEIAHRATARLYALKVRPAFLLRRFALQPVTSYMSCAAVAMWPNRYYRTTQSRGARSASSNGAVRRATSSRSSRSSRTCGKARSSCSSFWSTWRGVSSLRASSQKPSLALRNKVSLLLMWSPCRLWVSRGPKAYRRLNVRCSIVASEAATLVQTMALAIAHIHSVNVAHRDLKVP